jgi:type I restriction enzyme S subunit
LAVLLPAVTRLASTERSHWSSRELLYKIAVPTPPEPEQTKIAEVLSTVDRAIEKTEALIAKQQRIKTGLMQDLLTLGVDEHGSLRSESTHTFKDSPLGRIPEDWEVQSCLALCREIVVGIVIRPVQYYKPEGIPVLRSANVNENRINPSNLVFMSEKDNERLSKSQLSMGDLVTVRTGYPGTTAVVPPEFHGSNCIDVVISRPDHHKIRSEFLSIWINSDHGKRQVLEGKGGLAQQHFNVGEMRSLLVKVPALSEQQRIEEVLLRQSSSTSATSENLRKLNSLKLALRQDLLTGKKRVTPLLELELTH